MQIFITGTDTNIGKTIVSSWLCLHSGYDYFKPIQTGSIQEKDSDTISSLTDSKIYPESYIYSKPLSPHLAAHYQNEIIDISKILLPPSNNLIIEGAGGILVPINKSYLMVDLIKRFNIPVILVASSKLGTINHILLSLESLRKRNIPILGIIFNGDYDSDIIESIKFYGNIEILAQIPYLAKITKEVLKNITFGENLNKIFGL